MVEEFVFVVPRKELFEHRAAPEGFEADIDEGFLEPIARAGFFLERTRAEDDPDYKQIIPYGMVVHEDLVFRMRRRSGGGESRLHDKLSIGVGGHINPPDGATRGLSPEDGLNVLRRGFERELHEELIIETADEPEILGVLNDDSNAVGRVHFGIVYRVRAATSDVRVRETEHLEGEWISANALYRDRDRYETWSQKLVAAIWPNLSTA